MEVSIELSLLQGSSGERIRFTAQDSGWIEKERGNFYMTKGKGLLTILSLPCAPDGNYVTAVCDGVSLADVAIVSAKALLDGYDNPSFCPSSTTLIAGELLCMPSESEYQLFDRIINGWEWWMQLRASSKELAVAWAKSPNKDLLFLFNRIDAGFLDETPQWALANGRVSRLVGFHPSTLLFGESAKIPVLGATNTLTTHLITKWALGIHAFWDSLTADS